MLAETIKVSTYLKRGLLRSTNEKGMTSCHAQDEQVCILQMVQCGLRRVLAKGGPLCAFADAHILG